MKKKLSALFIFIFCLMTTASFVLASNSLPRLVDGANLLTANEKKELLSELDSISSKYHTDIVVVTMDTLGGKSAMDFADDFYDENGYAKDGVLLLVSMEYRDWWITTSGFGITAITDEGISYISNQFLPDLSDENYMEAFSVFANLCDDFIAQAKKGRPYDTGYLPKQSFPVGRNLVVSLTAGFLAALVITGIMRGQLKNVHAKQQAKDYVTKGSLHITRSHDLFLYRHIDRRKKADSSSHKGGSSTHRSSSGTTHGGGGGKF